MDGIGFSQIIEHEGILIDVDGVYYPGTPMRLTADPYDSYEGDPEHVVINKATIDTEQIEKLYSEEIIMRLTRKRSKK